MPVRRPVPAATYGIDLGKTRFDVIATDAAGKPVQRRKLGRDTILRFYDWMRLGD